MAELRGAGGTPGGMGEFLMGLVMAIAGGYLLTSRVTVSSGFWSWGGYDAFGGVLVLFVFSITLLFFNGRSVPGWLLLIGSVVAILVGIIANLRIYFEHTSLLTTLVMLVLLFGGIGLMARGVKAHG